MDAPAIRITVNGRRAVTVDMAAAEHDMSHDAMRKTLDRAGAQPIPGARIGRQPLYAASAVTAAISQRPGRGAPGVARPYRAG